MKSVHFKNRVKRIGIVIGLCAVLTGVRIDAFAQPAQGMRLVLVNLSGGADGLAMFQPSESSSAGLALNVARPTLYRTDAELSLLSGISFGFHSSLGIINAGSGQRGFKGIYDLGHMAVIQKAGIQNHSRAHVLAESLIANGLHDGLAGRGGGWVQRLSTRYFTRVFDVVDLSGGHETTRAGGQFTPFSQLGLNDYVGLGAGTDSTLFGENGLRADTFLRIALLAPSHAHAEEDRVAGEWQRIADSETSVRTALTQAPGGYAGNTMGTKFRDAEVALTKQASRIVYIRQDGYDRHASQENTYNTLLSELNAAVSNFQRNMNNQGLWGSTIIIVFSEFGRGPRENYLAGTDHGDGQTVFMMGGLVRGGVYNGALSTNELSSPQNALPIVTNLVDIFADAVTAMGFDPAVVFPGFTRNSLGLI